MGQLDGKVAVITGGGRGQGRSHAIELAKEGADIVIADIGGQIDGLTYGLATEDDIAETVRQVEALDRRIVGVTADVRSTEDMKRVADAAIENFGRIDIVLANAGIHQVLPDTFTMSDDDWQRMIDVNLTGVFKTTRAMIPHLIDAGGGSIVITSSTDGVTASPSWGHYGAAKAGIMSLAKTLALELAPEHIRVNVVIPTGVNSPMAEALMDTVPKTLERWGFATDRANLMREVGVIEPVDVSNAIVYLVSDKARYVTGISLPVDAGYTIKH
ncbi:MAG: mycofactocin-coupled SDR family oxidoreductase [Actinomycetaceae bacterium]